MLPSPYALPAEPANEQQRLAALRSYDILDTSSEATFDDIATVAAQITGSPIALITFVDVSRQWFKARIGLPASETPREQSFCAHAILTPEQALVVPDTLLDARFRENPLVVAPPSIRAYAGVPLVNPEGAALGTLCVIDRKPKALTEEQLQSLRRLASMAQSTLELRRASRAIRDFALTDPLTGLANRAALLEAIEATIARQRAEGDGFGLLYLDLDGFKAANDRFGHAAGDAALREAAAVLRAVLRRDDTIGRIGGDEFCAVLSSAHDAGIAAAERVRAALAACMSGHGWPITASIGVAFFTSPPDSAFAALAAADARMYAAKRAGRNRVG